MIPDSGKLPTSDGQRIAFHHYKNGHDCLVIVAHGFYNSKDSELIQELIKSLLDTYDVFAFDFRGHGKSSGLFTWSAKEPEDLKAVLKYLAGKYKKCGLIGFSYGGAISIIALAQARGVDSLVCVSSPSDQSKIDYHFWQLDWENDVWYNLILPNGRRNKGIRPGPFWLKKIKPIDALPSLEIPVMFIHGDKDWVIKPWHSEKMRAAAKNGELKIIPGGKHAEFLMRRHADELVTAIKNWFGRTLA